MTEAIVVRALLRIREHFVGFVDFLEVIFRGGFIFRDVGMIFARELTVALLDISFGRRPRHAEDFMIISWHRLSYFYVGERRPERLSGACRQRHQAPIRHAARPRMASDATPR